MKVDKEGVPTLIQEIRYRYGNMAFYVTFFSGKKRIFPSDFACPSIGLMQKQPTRMQWLEAQNTIEKFSIDNWGVVNA
jgi:hypothetical protein